MPFTEQPEGYRPHPDNIRACCWYCLASRRDIEDPTAEGGVRKERVFNTGVYLEANEQDRYDLLGLGPAGVPAMCETCLRQAAETMLSMVTPATYAGMKETADRAQMLDAQVKVLAFGKERVEAEAKDFSDRLEWMTSERDTARAQFTSLANLDRDSRDEAVVLREELQAAKVKLAASEARNDNKDAVIDALRRHAEPPAVKRAPGRPPASHAA